MNARTLLTSIAVALALIGCQQPAEIELDPGTSESNLSVHPVTVPDASVSTESVDTTGVLPAEQLDYRGQCLLNQVTLDNGQQKVSFAYSRVFFGDTAVQLSNRMIGFHGLDLGLVSLNGNAMVRLPHFVRFRNPGGQDTVLLRGFEYLSDLTSSYLPGGAYTWTIFSLRTGAVTISGETPEQLSVLSPQGGQTFSRTEPLVLQWRGGRGKVRVILSSFDPQTRRSRPLLELRALANSGKAFIPATILQQLPAGRFYVLTFVLSNRKDVPVMQQHFTGKIFVQAASVYTTYVEIR
jgi:hypothetical protein